MPKHYRDGTTRPSFKPESLSTPPENIRLLLSGTKPGSNPHRGQPVGTRVRGVRPRNSPPGGFGGPGPVKNTGGGRRNLSGGDRFTVPGGRGVPVERQRTKPTTGVEAPRPGPGPDGGRGGRTGGDPTTVPGGKPGPRSKPTRDTRDISDRDRFTVPGGRPGSERQSTKPKKDRDPTGVPGGRPGSERQRTGPPPVGVEAPRPGPGPDEPRPIGIEAPRPGPGPDEGRGGGRGTGEDPTDVRVSRGGATSGVLETTDPLEVQLSPEGPVPGESQAERRERLARNAELRQARRLDLEGA